MLRYFFTLILIFGIVAFTAAQSVFNMPALFPQHKRYLALFIENNNRNDMFGAETAVRAALKIFPRDANWNYNLACVCARDGRADEAMEWLTKAVDLGFTSSKQLETDNDLKLLRNRPAFTELLAKAKKIAANPPKNPTLSSALPSTVAMGTEARVEERNTMWNWDPNQGGYFTTRFDLVKPTNVSASYTGPYAELIAPWLAEGSAAGNGGDLYVNRDEDRTSITSEAFPLLTPVLYSDVAVKTAAHLGAGNALFAGGLAPIATIGNSILAMNQPPFWRSIPRLISTDSSAAMIANRLSMANQLYIYDATFDHSKAMRGDLLIANNPQFLISGNFNSSSPETSASQRQLTELVLAAMAALHPEVKREMLRQGLLVPTLQRLLRQNLKGKPDYFSATAHPTVFDPARIDGKALIMAAHALTIETLAHFPSLTVRQETMPRQYVDYFDAVGSERLSDSPSLISRVVRGRAYTRRLTVEASLVNEADIQFKWIVINGDPAKIRILPLTSNGSLTTLEIDYHAPYVSNEGMPIRRVDLACIATRKNGTLSAPSFVSLRSLANERRLYNSQGRLLSIDYTVPKEGLVYEDPILTAAKNWQDLYRYSDDGTLLGWFRKREGQAPESFDIRGRRILETTTKGLPKKVVPVSYLPRISQGDSIQAPAIELLQSDVGNPIELN
ncbi:MAG: hypothetical protein RSB14_01160 [Kiritimatiellia bacterium]